jgi:hypothetical protein
MFTDPALATIKKLSSGVVASDIPNPSAEPPVANGEPGTVVRTPVAGSTEKALTLLLPELAAYRKFFTIAVVMRLEAKNPPPIPVPPVRKGEPGTGVSEPLAAMEKADMLLEEGRSLLV